MANYLDSIEKIMLQYFELQGQESTRQEFHVAVLNISTLLVTVRAFDQLRCQTLKEALRARCGDSVIDERGKILSEAEGLIP